MKDELSRRRKPPGFPAPSPEPLLLLSPKFFKLDNVPVSG
jgi:hypothetical protein